MLGKWCTGGLKGWMNVVGADMVCDSIEKFEDFYLMFGVLLVLVYKIIYGTDGTYNFFFHLIYVSLKLHIWNLYRPTISTSLIDKFKTNHKTFTYSHPLSLQLWVAAFITPTLTRNSSTAHFPHSSRHRCSSYPAPNHHLWSWSFLACLWTSWACSRPPYCPFSHLSRKWSPRHWSPTDRSGSTRGTFTLCTLPDSGSISTASRSAKKLNGSCCKSCRTSQSPISKSDASWPNTRAREFY